MREKMLKQHKWKLLVSSLVILLPMIVGLCLWNILPDVIPIHWDINGNPDGFAGKAVAVFALPEAVKEVDKFFR